MPHQTIFFNKFLNFLRKIIGSPTLPNNNAAPNATSNINALDKSLKLENILIEEYNFSKNYSIQVLHDRRETVYLYILVIGIAASAITLIALNTNTHANLNLLTFVILVIFGFYNLFFYIHFVNIGKVYKDSIFKMKIIRDFYIDQFQNQVPGIRGILSPNLEFNSPDILRPTNHNVCLVFASNETLSFIIAVFVSDKLWPNFNYGILLYARPYFLIAVLILVILITHILYYRHVFKR